MKLLGIKSHIKSSSAVLKKWNSSRSAYKLSDYNATPMEWKSSQTKMKKTKRDPSAKTNLSRYSKQTFSSINYSKERRRIGSDTFLTMTDFNTAKLKRVGSIASSKINKSKLKSAKKKSKNSRNTSTKRSKKYTKSVKYWSPNRFMPNNYIKKTKKNIENFKKQYMSKKFPIKIN